MLEKSLVRTADRFRSLFALDGPTEPAGNPSFLGLPTGRLFLGGVGSPSKCFFVLPFGRPGRLFTGTCWSPFVFAAGGMGWPPVPKPSVDGKGWLVEGLAMDDIGLSMFSFKENNYSFYLQVLSMFKTLIDGIMETCGIKLK